MASSPPGARALPVAIALGSNLGDRRAHLEFALSRLQTLVPPLTASSFLETDPVGVGPQPAFLNAAAIGRTTREPADLLRELLAIERERGRTRPFHGAPRSLDLDLILYGDRIIESGELVVPHPRFRERRFVLEPLAEIAPDWIDPVSGLSMRELLARARGT